MIASLCLIGGGFGASAQTIDAGPSIVAVGGDAVANGTPSLATSSLNYLFNGTTWDRARGDLNGVYVGGNVASGAADAGRPVKIGGRYNATAPTLTDGQRGDLQMTAKGYVIVVSGANSAVTDNRDNGNFVLPTATNGVGGMTPVGNFVFNGTSWDRQRGDTSGVFISGATLTALQSVDTKMTTQNGYLDGVEATLATIAANTAGVGTGASTAALQTAGNASVASIDTDLGTANDAPITGGNGSVISQLKGANSLLTSMNANLSGSIPFGTNNIGNTGGLETPNAAVTGGGTRMMGKDPVSGYARDLLTGTNGGLLPGQAGPTSVVVSTVATTATQAQAANANRVAFEFEIETTLTAPLYMSWNGQTGCSNTVHDKMFPTGTAAGTQYTAPFGFTGSIYYQTAQASASLLLTSWSTQ